MNSTYVDQMATNYDTPKKGINGHKGTKQIIGRGTYLGQIVIKPKNKNTNITDDDVQAEIEHQIKKGVLPPADLNTLYMVYFPVTVTITLDGLTSCQDFGAYHFATVDDKLSKKNIFYAVEPDCHSSLNSITFAASHEYAEATTDNVPTPGSVPDFPAGLERRQRLRDRRPLRRQRHAHRRRQPLDGDAVLPQHHGEVQRRQLHESVTHEMRGQS